MAQHDQVIDNGPGLAVRTDINAAIAALFSSSSGTVQPAVMVAGQLWFNTTTGKLQVRNSGNTAWQSLTGEVDGTINVGTTNNWVEFTGTTPSVETALLNVRDNRVTTGAVGNAVFAIKRQNSATPALMIGNDANNAGLIGSNNTPTRLGKWVSGVFTEYLNMSTTGAFVMSGGLTISPLVSGQGLSLLQSTDTHSARLWWQSATHGWSATVNETDGYLGFASGAVPNSATGTSRVRMYETGMLSSGNWLDALGLQVSSGFNGTRRALYQGSTSAGAGIAYIQAMDDTGTEDSRVEVRNAYLNVRSMATEPTSHKIRIADTTNMERVALYHDAGNAAVVYGRDAANARLGFLAILLDGRATHGNATGSWEIIDTGNLELTTYTGTSAVNTSFPVGSIVPVQTNANPAIGSTVVPCLDTANNWRLLLSGLTGAGTALAGTWRARGRIDVNGNQGTLAQRVA